MARRQRTTEPTLFDSQILEKRCTKCRVVKPLTDFYKTPQSRNGRTSACCECTKIATRRCQERQKEKAKHVTEKTCRDCGISKPLSDFKVAVTGRYGRMPECKACAYPVDRERYAKTKDCPERRKKVSEKERTRLLRKYGMSKADFEVMNQSQQGLCAICKRPENAGRPDGSKKPRLLCIDHDHATGKVRSLLCSQCNHGLGNFGDDPELLTAAIAYLQFHAEKDNETP